MKPALFQYHRVQSLEAALSHLAAEEDALVLAGGQSLLPAMNFRLISPSSLIDIAGIEALRRLEITAQEVVVGAGIRHRDLEQSEAVYQVQPVLRKALHHVAHVPIRHRGTTVGSICHADAAAEMPMILVLTGGAVTATSQRGSRRIEAKDFFRFHMTTTRAQDELITSAHFPLPPAGSGAGFAEFARRRGDYAIAAIGAILTPGEGGRVAKASIAACGIANTPIRLPEAEAALIGRVPDAALLRDIGEIVAQSVTAPDDPNASRAYRKHLTRGLTGRAIAEAVEGWSE